MINKVNYKILSIFYAKNKAFREKILKVILFDIL